MHKRDFIKTVSVLTAAASVSQLFSCEAKAVPRTNWAGNLTYSTDNLFTPGDITSFNKIADSTQNQISSSAFNKMVSLDKIKNTVTVEAGIKYGEFCKQLDENGYALHNLASLPHISVAGACATSTHGSGIRNGSLATAVIGIEFVNGKGELINLTKEKDGDEFAGAIVNLGALGIVTKLTLSLQPTFKMKQIVYQNLPMAELEKNFEDAVLRGE